VIGPDGVNTTGKSVDEVIEIMRETTPIHLGAMGLNGDQISGRPPIVKTIQVAS
jgi:predicted RNase H-like HicB family nuclease